MRYAGMHWPTGGENPSRQAIYDLPGVRDGVLLMLADSARYWYAEARQHCPLVIWRGLPRQGFLPADLNWNPVAVARECLNLWNEQPHGGTEYFTPLNELQFPWESGEEFKSFSYLRPRLGALRTELRRLLPPSVKLVYPAWCPDQPYPDAPFAEAEAWIYEAMEWDVISAHVYHHDLGDPEFEGPRNVIRSWETWRRLLSDRFGQAGTDKPLVFKEWNAGSRPDLDRAMLKAAGEVCARDPHVLGYTYYIWQTQRSHETHLNVWPNPDRLALFTNPPTVEEPQEPEPQPMYRLPGFTPSYADIRDGAIHVSDERGLPRRRLLGLCLAESGFGLQSFDRWASIERTARMVSAINAEDWPRVEAIFGEIKGTATNDISFGPCHQSWYWWSGYPGDRSQGDPHRHNLEEIIEFRAHMIEDHGTALRTAADLIARPGNDLDALCLYNKPNVAPINNPNRPNYQRSLVEADRILAEMEPEEPEQPVPPGTKTEYHDYTDPQPAGTLTSCNGVIFHGSRSGRAGNPLDAEWQGTANYEVNNPLGLGWNATIGPGKVALHMDARTWGHNARAASDNYVAVEIAQPTVNDPLPPNVATALGDYIFDHVWPVWGEVWHFPSHSELEDWGETGANDGKTDLYPTGDERMNQFRELVYARLRERQAGQPTEPEPEPPTYEQLANLEGVAYHDDGTVIPALEHAIAAGDWIQVQSVVKFLRENDPHRAA